MSTSLKRTTRQARQKAGENFYLANSLDTDCKRPLSRKWDSIIGINASTLTDYNPDEGKVFVLYVT
jgi:hypothetical protein